MHVAAEKNSADVIKFLMRAGADENARNKVRGALTPFLQSINPFELR